MTATLAVVAALATTSAALLTLGGFLLVFNKPSQDGWAGEQPHLGGVLAATFGFLVGLVFLGALLTSCVGGAW